MTTQIQKSLSEELLELDGALHESILHEFPENVYNVDKVKFEKVQEKLRTLARESQKI